MTTEERFAHIEALNLKTDERISAIAMHLEIVAGMQEANEKATEEMRENIKVLNQRTIQAMEAIGRLANIAAAHEERIDHLEGQ
jgi:hypothetical protein